MEKVISGLFLFLSLSCISQSIQSDSIQYFLPSNFTGQIAVKKFNGEFIYKKNFGNKDRLKVGAINDSTLFNIGQLSHSFVDFAIQHLLKLSKIKLSENITSYLPQFPYENITVEHLINHQSGLPASYLKFYHKEYYNDWNIKLEDRQKRMDNDDLLLLIHTKKPTLSFEPGKKTQYADFNYLILVSLLERVTQKDFEFLIKELVSQSHIPCQPKACSKQDTMQNKGWGYRFFPDSTLALCDNLRSRGFPFDDGTKGNQHIYLSASDLAHWGQFLIQEFHLDSVKPTKTRSFPDPYQFTYDNELNILRSKGGYGGIHSHIIYTYNHQWIVTIHSALLNPDMSSNALNELLRYLNRIQIP